jgi:hypothetical protein
MTPEVPKAEPSNSSKPPAFDSWEARGRFHHVFFGWKVMEITGGFYWQMT